MLDGIKSGLTYAAETFTQQVKFVQENPSKIINTRTVAAIALPMLAICAIESIPVAEAGPIAYASCVAGCEALATVATGGPGAAFIGQCIAACWPVLAMPTP